MSLIKFWISHSLPFKYKDLLHQIKLKILRISNKWYWEANCQPYGNYNKSNSFTSYNGFFRCISSKASVICSNASENRDDDEMKIQQQNAENNQAAIDSAATPSCDGDNFVGDTAAPITIQDSGIDQDLFYDDIQTTDQFHFYDILAENKLLCW